MTNKPQDKHLEDNEESRCSSLFDEPSFSNLHSDDDILNLPQPDERLHSGLVKLEPSSTADEDTRPRYKACKRQKKLKKAPTLMEILCRDASESDSSFDRSHTERVISDIEMNKENIDPNQVQIPSQMQSDPFFD